MGGAGIVTSVTYFALNCVISYKGPDNTKIYKYTHAHTQFQIEICAHETWMKDCRRCFNHNSKTFCQPRVRVAFLILFNFNAL